ncbi:hypothetical protein Dimus_005985 [Dionaea muscipula]
MDVKPAMRVSKRPSRAAGAAFLRHRQPANDVVCTFWLGGNCTRNPCRFLHPGSETDAKIRNLNVWNRSASDDCCNALKKEKVHLMKADLQFYQSQRKQKVRAETVDDGCYEGQMKYKVRPNNAPVLTSDARGKQALPGICEYWITGNCVHGEKCRYLHSWHRGDGFSLLTHLEGHNKAVTGITLPSESQSLYTGSKDGTVRIWNCHTGKCTGVVDMGAEVGSMITEGPWVFVGISNAVKAWNIQTLVELTLGGPVGQVYSMAFSHDMLLAGTHDGAILAWRCNSETSSFEPGTCLNGHSRAVVSLVVGAGGLYSGSMDGTIRVWDLETFQCTRTLNGHDKVVMSLLCWDQFLLSCSLDKNLKVWAATEGGDLDVTYTHAEEHGILTLCGLHDADAKPILFCSLNDNSVGLYELPSLAERGRIFARKEIRTIQIGPGGLFFTGDGTGRVSVWRFLREPAPVTTSSSS